MKPELFSFSLTLCVGLTHLIFVIATSDILNSSPEETLLMEIKKWRTEMIGNRLVNFTWYVSSLPSYRDAETFCTNKKSSLPPARELRFFYKTLQQKSTEQDSVQSESSQRVNGSSDEPTTKNDQLPSIIFYLRDRLETTLDHPSDARGERLCLLIKKTLKRDIALAEQEAERSCYGMANLIVCRKLVENRNALMTEQDGYDENYSWRSNDGKGVGGTIFNGTICLNSATIYVTAALLLTVILLLLVALIIFVTKFRRLQKLFRLVVAKNSTTSLLLNQNNHDNGDVDLVLERNPVGQLIGFSRQGSTALRREGSQRITNTTSFREPSSATLIRQLSKLNDNAGKNDVTIPPSKNNRSTNFL